MLKIWETSCTEKMKKCIFTSAHLEMQKEPCIHPHVHIESTELVTNSLLWLTYMYQYVQMLLTLSDQDRISPYNINTISSGKVMRIKKTINLGIIVDPIRNSPN